MFPLYDNSRRLMKVPAVTLSLIAINITVFAMTFFSGGQNFLQIVRSFGLVPKLIMSGEAVYSFITSLFLHGDPIHLLANMWFLWIFGRSVEDEMGKIRFIILYFITGIFAGIFHVLSATLIIIPAIGASGAISGILGAYLILFPKNKIRAFFLLLYKPVFFDIYAYFYLLIWFFYQFVYASGVTNVAYSAHIGGFIAGLVLALLIRRRTKRTDYYVVGKNVNEVAY